LAHQIRNPLFGISAILDVLEVERPADEPLQNTVSEIRSQVGRIGRILQDLTDLVTEQPRPSHPTSVCGTVEQAVASVREMAALEAVGIHTCLEDRTALVHAEPAGLVRVWRAVLEQAVSQSPPGSEVRLELSCAGGENCVEVGVSVFDGGGGLGKVPVAQAFAPFGLRRRGDTGLELATARHIVHAHGGLVEARERDGGGSVFVVRLPRIAEDRKR
jgi:signal transduction histidine kinase